MTEVNNKLAFVITIKIVIFPFDGFVCLSVHLHYDIPCPAVQYFCIKYWKLYQKICWVDLGSSVL
jgi:hypothetical protein